MSDSPTKDGLAVAAPDPSRSAAVRRVALILIAIGGLLTLLALLSDTGRSRVGFAYLLGFSFCWAIVLGSLFFVALQHITRSVWSVVLRRVAEMFAASMWLIALLFVPLALFALFHDQFGIFPWMNAEVVASDPLLEGKAPYLNAPFWIVRGGGAEFCTMDAATGQRAYASHQANRTVSITYTITARGGKMIKELRDATA